MSQTARPSSLAVATQALRDQGYKEPRTDRMFWMPLPPPAASINFHKSWRATHFNKDVKQYQELAKQLCGDMLERGHLPKGARLLIHYVWLMGQHPEENRQRAMGKTPKLYYRPKDQDNAISAMKRAQDSFRDAGLVEDDSATRLGIGSVSLFRSEKQHCGYNGIWVAIEVINEGA